MHTHAGNLQEDCRVQVVLSTCVCVCRFDSELSAAQEEVQRERTLREKLSREKDMLTGDAFSLRQQLEV